MIRVITLESENSMIQLICEDHYKNVNQTVEVIDKIYFDQVPRIAPSQTGFDAWKRASRRHDSMMKPTLIDYGTSKELSRKDASKTWLFVHV